MAKMEYLTEIFGQLNIVNRKIKLLFGKTEQNWVNLMFPTMRTNCTGEMIPIVVKHLTALEENIDYYFSSLNTEKYDWISNSFIYVPSNSGLQLCEEELATVSSDRSLKLKHSAVNRDTF